VNSGPVDRETFSRNDRLRKRREFEECYASGVRVSGRHILVFLLPGDSAPAPRMGISVSRRVGAAVVRNRVRRRMREIFRRSRSLFRGLPVRVVVNARPSAASASIVELSEDFRSAVARGLGRIGRK
jgi:ribonuclease P protein component